MRRRPRLFLTRHIFAVLMAGMLAVVFGCTQNEPDSPSSSPTQTAAVQSGQEPSSGPRFAQVPPVSDPAQPKVKTVVIDAGHGGDEVGAARNGVVEKLSNLDMAFRVEALLKEQGVRVVLTRREDTRVSFAGATGGPGTGFTSARVDLQSRVDIANAERADIFLSIHSNGSSDEGQRGVEVWYDGLRPFADKNARFARMILNDVLVELDAIGYSALNRGIQDDSCWRSRNDRCFQLFILGPERETTSTEVAQRGGNPADFGLGPQRTSFNTRATSMPGALAELLFISNVSDNAMLRSDTARDAMARGLVRALMEFLASEGSNA